MCNESVYNFHPGNDDVLMSDAYYHCLIEALIDLSLLWLVRRNPRDVAISEEEKKTSYSIYIFVFQY